MARHKNMQWTLPEGKLRAEGGHEHSWESIHAAVLMDIRDELQGIRRVLECPGTQAIPLLLEKIGANTAKSRKRKGKPR